MQRLVAQDAEAEPSDGNGTAETSAEAGAGPAPDVSLLSYSIAQYHTTMHVIKYTHTIILCHMSCHPMGELLLFLLFLFLALMEKFERFIPLCLENGV